ncbi:sigma factor-like helix-turn-helix DNA-binding protein [Bacillus tuaregi]|uniref:sigma factor-like helix-turn-helix DNA-binding protein n=1 Tax=Bacillus tuaregi TaxID=1816695 RepID=UPI0008F8CC92|nr:sigma factor-like helix-turn-helix DNA-binding protein [Bacillus tuaregi]
MIYFYSIDFDKKLRKNRERNLLIIDYLPEKGNSDNNIPISIGSLKEQIENSALYLALDELSNKQVKILELFYVYNFTNKEIADYFHDSPQNTSNLHKKALKKLKSALLSRKDTIC